MNVQVRLEHTQMMEVERKNECLWYFLPFAALTGLPSKCPAFQGSHGRSQEGFELDSLLTVEMLWGSA